ncbi:MAG: hypothetical protein JWL94_1500 [Microbacteriaceae bacterium]|jgi:murein DD-endopeptidase MepM/ murein hydrolase activator NlpD|nr:hypothetical protein [Microbacteriaceae bacterium]
MRFASTFFASLAALAILASAAQPASAESAAAADFTSFSRIHGPDRFTTAVAVSETYPAGVPVVYVASGATFPDALSAAPAAAAQGGPLLLTTSDGLPAVVRNEVVRLAPRLIVVAGGEASVSAAVYDELATLAPSIRRDGGADRYEASRTINRNAFPAGSVTTAYFATGANFPDALSASAAAGGRGGAVVLVDGRAPAIDLPTRELMSFLGLSSAYIAGGPDSVSPHLEDSLTDILGASQIVRMSGVDRYAASSSINRLSFSSAPTVYFAVGTGFADALYGAAIAGRENAPLFVVPGDCIPSYVLEDLKALGATARVLLGGPASLGVGVENLTECSTGPTPVLAPAGFSKPFDSVVPVSSHFGVRIHPITGTRTMHNGTDYARNQIAGTPIRSIGAGTIVSRTVSYATSGAGNSVTVRHDGGFQSVSMHMRDPSPLSVGASVAAGAVIGHVGSTGGSTGAHLHLEVRMSGTPIDPYVFLSRSPLATPPGS